MAFNTIEDVIQFIRDEDVQFVDMRFTDVPGAEQRITIPADTFTEEAAEEASPLMVPPSAVSPPSTSQT